jgi:hypothetical protein
LEIPFYQVSSPSSNNFRIGSYHFWAFLANSIDLKGGVNQGVAEANAANWFHESVQSPSLPGPLNAGGATMNDYVLSEAAMEIGVLISNQAISPSELAPLIRETLGSSSGGRLQELGGRPYCGGGRCGSK